MIRFASLVLLVLATISLAQTRPTTDRATTRLADTGGAKPDEPPAGMAVYVGDEMIRDYRPRSTLVAAAHPRERAKFAAVDAHCHWSLAQEPRQILAAMDALNVSHAVNLSGGHGPALWAQLDKFAGPASDGRLLIFANLDFAQIDDPTFGPKMADFFTEAKRRGVAGVKIFKGLGLTVRDKADRLIAVDDARLDPVWRRCGELGLPVLIHSADPVAFFQPVDERNERWMQLKRHPDWAFVGPRFPTWETVVEQRNRVIATHPETTFIVAHMAEGANDYARLSSWLDAMPNMVIDLSGRENEIGRQPRASRAFFTKYADRILFGTDRFPGRLDQPRYRVLFRMLETGDENFDYHEYPFPPGGEWKIYGLELPDDVLVKVYGGNARRVLRLDAAPTTNAVILREP